MIGSNLAVAVGMTVLFFAHVTTAQTEPSEPWEMSLSLGYVGTTGNTKTRTYNGEFRSTWHTTDWTHNFKLRGLGSNEEGESRAERYLLEEKSDYNLNDDQYLFVRGTYIKDRFSGFGYQASLGTGYGRDILENESFSLQGFSGLGYRFKQEVNGVKGGREGEVVLTLGEELDWDLSESSSIYQELNTEIGSELTVTTFEVGLQTNIMGGVATKIAFQARNNSNVPEGREKTDTQTSVSLVYSF